MKITKKLIAILLSFIIVLGSFSYIYPVTAQSKNEQEINLESNIQQENNLDVDDDIERYSEAYKEYLELSDEEKAKVEVIPRKYDIPLSVLYENKNNSSMLYGASAEAEIPEQFDLRDEINISVGNQGSYGLCWDFASMKSLETNLALNGYGNYDFSELHVDYMTSNQFYGFRELHQGGNFEYFCDYLERFLGPVLENDVPYNAVYDGEEDRNYLTELSAQAYVGEIINFPTINKKFRDYTDEELNSFRNEVKKHIMKNGSLYCSVATPDYGTDYFNTVTFAEYFSRDSQHVEGRVTHAVSIIGWDDNYSRNNFKTDRKPTNNGAYIVMNSWGENWGDNGVFYVSYEDFLIEEAISGIVEASTTNDYIEEIQFEDAVLYRCIKNRLGNDVLWYDNNTLTIKISKLALSNLNYLTISDVTIENLSDLENFTKLKYISFSNCEISDVTIENLSSLETINFFNCEIGDYSCLNKLKSLKDLTICDKTADFNFLTELTNLEDISLINCNLGNDIIDILAETNVKRIYLSENNITDVTKLNRLNLEFLDLSQNLNINLATIPNNVKALMLDECNLTDIEALQNFNGEALYLSFNYNLKNIDVLRNAKNLKRLYIADTIIEDISFIEELSQIEEIYVSSKLKNIGHIPESLDEIQIYTEFDLNELEKNEGKIILPNYFKQLQEVDKNLQINSYIYYDTNEDAWLEERDIEELENGDLAITLDREVNDEKLSGDREIRIRIENGIAQYSMCVISYNTIKELEKIEIQNQPTKLNYVEGDLFDTTGMVVKKVYDDGNKETLSNYTITPNRKLTTQDKKITVSYTENGITKTATIDIEVEEQKLNTTYKKEEGYISKILPNTAITDFKNNLTTNIALKITNEDNSQVEENGIIKTGMILTAGEKSYKLAVIGDLNGDGKMTITDLVRLKLKTVNQISLENEYAKAADLNFDGAVTITDLVRLNLMLVNVLKIQDIV